MIMHAFVAANMIRHSECFSPFKRNRLNVTLSETRLPLRPMSIKHGKKYLISVSLTKLVVCKSETFCSSMYRHIFLSKFLCLIVVAEKFVWFESG